MSAGYVGWVVAAYKGVSASGHARGYAISSGALCLVGFGTYELVQALCRYQITEEHETSLFAKGKPFAFGENVVLAASSGFVTGVVASRTTFATSGADFGTRVAVIRNAGVLAIVGAGFVVADAYVDAWKDRVIERELAA